MRERSGRRLQPAAVAARAGPILASLEAAGAAVGLVYFDVFEREQTALDRPELREGVLGGPDTTARAEVVWQVKVLPVPSIALADAAMAGLSARVDAVRDLRQMLAKADTEDERRRTLRRALRTAVRALAAAAAAAGIACDLSPAEWDALIAPRAPQMAVDTPSVSPDDGPCAAPPDADYLGPENQLYRVEVHSTGAGGSRAPAASSGRARMAPWSPKSSASARRRAASSAAMSWACTAPGVTATLAFTTATGSSTSTTCWN
ncbi:MAG: hypothetical protein H6643_06650 [Caldilineaceae bacterium]|nr:hypothetical protein [Caldilineaceae bacterium]